MLEKTFTMIGLWCCALGLAAQSGTIVSPKANDVWMLGSQRQVQWTFAGNATVKLQLFSASGAKVGAIKSGLPLAAGSFPWTVGRLENGQMVPPAKGYRLQLVRSDGAPVVLHKDAGPFEIAATQVVSMAKPPAGGAAPVPGQVFSLRQPLIVHAPKGGDVWKPMADYAITWEAAKNKHPASAYDFDILLIAVKNPAFTPLLLKTHHWAVARSTPHSNIYTMDWKFLGSMNIPSGKYRVAIRSVSIADFKAESDKITVQNTISGNTGFIGEDEPDLIIEDVYYDAAKKSMWARVRNQGFSSYSGPLAITYHFTLGSITYTTPVCQSKMGGEAKFTAITLNKYQSNSYLLCKWPCFDKRPADFFPITGPVNYDVYLNATGKPAASKTGVVCASKVADIIVDSHFLLRGSGDPATLFAFQQASLSPGSLHWVSDTAFEAKVEVQVWNWGCQGKQFEVKLHMDGKYLNGKNEVTLGTISLAPGQKATVISNPVKFSIPKDGQYYKMLLVAYQGEANGEGYPDAYKNNFVLTHVQLKQRSNTVTGRVDW
jgi:hypothetical protein